MSEQNKNLPRNDLQNNILDLEKRYFEVLWNIFTDDDFLRDLNQISNNISENYEYLDMYWQNKNKLKIPFERLLRYYLYRNLDVRGVYYSPLSSDISFYTEEVLLNIDAKTTDLDGNAGDDVSIIFEKNQISFRNKVKNQVDEFSGVHYDPNLPAIDPVRNLPVLTFFLRITYTDDFRSFKLDHMTLDCVPNGELSELFDYDLIENFKTYHYISKTFAKKISRDDLIPKSTIDSHWESVRVGGGNYFYDEIVSNPLYLEENVVWAKIDGQYKAMLSGHSARINNQNTRVRYDSNNREWFGHKRKVL